MLQKIKQNQKSIILLIGCIVASVIILNVVSGELANRNKSSVTQISYDTVETVCNKIGEKINADEKVIKDTFTVTRESEFNINMVDKFVNHKKYKITDVKFDIISDNESKLTLTIKRKLFGVI